MPEMTTSARRETDEIFRRSVRIERPAPEVFAWHERPGAFARLCPPWERVEVLAHVGGIRDGARVSLRTRIGPFWTAWEIVHRDYVAGRQFRDVLLRGPFAKWEHLHLIEPAGPGACVLTDEIRYRLPLGALGRLGGAALARRQLERMFVYRHAVTKADTEGATAGPRRCVLVTGASGLIGRGLVAFLRTQGHVVRSLGRGTPRGPDEFQWDPAAGKIDPAALAGVDAIVHLAGENVAGGRWTAARKAAILASRVQGTRTLAAAIAACAPSARPEVLVSASAVGYYGHRGDERLSEAAAAGDGFLAEVCQAWEREVAAVEPLGVRTVALRTGVVLTPAGGALAKMLPAFRAGVSGRLGSGRQWMGWIAPDDLAAMYERALLDPVWRGPCNAVAPEPVTNAEFTATLARVLRRPAVLPTPAFLLKLIFGRMAEDTLLVSTRAMPERARATGFTWRHAELEAALRHVLGR
ncbi:MAG: TIGR01777 family oxidoreductase [Opitutaceae bacterium]|nr:TIGR01777 family oxidoreductase [Opitutaceae bacterium]